MMTKRCACCDQPFEPRPQVPDQAFCSSPDCQRARKRQWQRDKLKADPDYRINQPVPGEIHFRTYYGGRPVEWRVASLHSFKLDDEFPYNDRSVIGFNW